MCEFFYVRRYFYFYKTRFFLVRYPNFLVRCLENGYISSFQISMLRLLLKKYFKKVGSYYFYVFPSIICTKKSLGVRMGRGKGSFFCFKANLKKGNSFLELSGVSYSTAFQIYKEIKSKISLKCQLILNQKMSLL